MRLLHPFTLCMASALAVLTARAPGHAVTYQLTEHSRFDVVTGKSGLLGFAGHAHRIRASRVSGRIDYDPDSVLHSTVHLSVPVAELEVLTPPDTGEQRQVRHAMLSDVLHPDTHPEITLDGTLTRVDEDSATVSAVLTMEGVSDTVPVRISLRVAPDTITAVGRFSVRQTDFGIKPYRGGPLGSVRVADKITFEFNAEAVRTP